MMQSPADAITSPWWRSLLEWLFPDKKLDGQFQNPGSEKVFDFDDVIGAENPLTVLASEVTYYPPQDQRELFAVFIPGLGQDGKEASRRSRRYAATLKTGVANLNNGTFLKQDPILKRINPFLDWIDAVRHRLGLADSPAIENTTQLILKALEHKVTLNLSADSHGTILLGRALKRAKRRFIESHAQKGNAASRQAAEQQWGEQAQSINVFCFGNAYLDWPRGPRYIMVSITGDVLAESIGINPANAARRQRDDLQFIIFDRLFAEGSFEAHNMMFSTEMLKQTFEKNNLEVGDFLGLYTQLQQKTLQLITPNEMMWPADMPDYTWNEDSLEVIQLTPSVV